jgi:hypothetical protein
MNEQDRVKSIREKEKYLNKMIKVLYHLFQEEYDGDYGPPPVDFNIHGRVVGFGLDTCYAVLRFAPYKGKSGWMIQAYIKIPNRHNGREGMYCHEYINVGDIKYIHDLNKVIKKTEDYLKWFLKKYKKEAKRIEKVINITKR